MAHASTRLIVVSCQKNEKTRSRLINGRSRSQVTPLPFDSISPRDPIVIGIVSSAISVVAFIASGLPGVRSAFIDPAAALRASEQTPDGINAARQHAESPVLSAFTAYCEMLFVARLSDAAASKV